MSDSIRKAWLLEYLIAYAEKYGGQLSSSLPKKGKVQIINFRTLPESPEEWVWADVSDKRHFVTVRFTMEAVKSFNNKSRNAGRRLTSRRWGVATIRCSRPFLCQRPTNNGKGLEDESTIALIVDEVEVAGSEGEAMFGDPRCLTQEGPMRRWLEGLRQGSGGSVLQLERLEREMNERELNDPGVKKSPAPPPRIDTMLRVDSGSSKSSGNISTDKRRHKRWLTKVKDLGLVLAYGLYKISEDQHQILENVAVFGQDLQPLPSARQSPASKHESLAQHTTTMTLNPSSPTSRQAHIVSPNTPSHWSASQRTNLGRDIEGDDSNSILPTPLYSPLKQGDSVDQDDGGEEAESEARRETPSGDYRRELEAHEQLEDSTLSELRSIAPNPTLPPTPNIPQVEHQRGHSPSPASIRNPVVLVPDSDISGSHSQSRTYSQSLSLTQPSISQHSIPSQQNRQGLISQKNVPESSYPQTLPLRSKPSAIEMRNVAQRQGNNTLDPKNNQLDTDDESAQQILLSANAEASHTPSHPHVITPQKPGLVNLTCPIVAVAHPRVIQGSSTFNDLPGKIDERVLTLATTSHAAKVDHGQKRKLAESSGVNVFGDEPATKRQRGRPTDDVVIERVGHDAIAWKQPSFVHSEPKATLKEETTTHVNINRAGLTHNPRIMIPRPQVDATNPRVPTPSHDMNSLFESRKQTRLKLGGWQPQKDLPNAPGVMTWKNFNAMLLMVGRVREQMNNPTTRAG